jgi:Ca-activated chloride channel family protein
MIKPMILITGLVPVFTFAALLPSAEAVTPQPLQPRATAALAPGAPVAVTISGSRPGGRIELWGPVTQTDKGGRIDSFTEAGGSAQLTAPTTPGSYELRYVDATGALLARATLEVAANPVTLAAPGGVSAGMESQVEWRGPANPGDMIQVYDPSNGAVLAEVPATGQPGVVNVAVLRGPESLGDYEIRYWSNTSQVSLRSLPITVEAGNAWLRTPIEVFVRESFRAEWNGPTDADHLYQIVDPDTGSLVSSQMGSGTGSANLTAPARPGNYRVQIVNAQSGFVLADLPLDVDPK